MTDAIHERAQLLIAQSRHQEAITLLEAHLERYPDDLLGRCLYLTSLVNSGQKEKGRAVLNALLADEPDSPVVLNLAAHVCLSEEKYADAEAYARKTIDLLPVDPDSHIVLARVKLAQRNYDRAIESVDKALELEPENVEALNLKTYVAGLLGKADTRETLQEALQRAPENPFTIANQGMQLIREGKTTEALERLKYALSLDPTNQLARYAMREAIKSKFIVYRMFFKYQEWTGRLTGSQSWMFLIGTYLAFRILRGVQRENPELGSILTPLIIIIAAAFLLTWVISPLMNLYLMLNRYGRLLLDANDKRMATYTGCTLLASLCCLAGYFISGSDEFLIPALVFALFMIPLGTFLQIDNPGNRQKISWLTYGIIICGLLAMALDVGALYLVTYFGLIAYQWIFNGMMIKENARTVG